MGYQLIKKNIPLFIIITVNIFTKYLLFFTARDWANSVREWQVCSKHSQPTQGLCVCVCVCVCVSVCVNVTVCEGSHWFYKLKTQSDKVN